jgi:peroxiredoxin
MKISKDYMTTDTISEMVNFFKDDGYDIFSISTDKSKHDDSFPFRHGVTVCKKFKKLSN